MTLWEVGLIRLALRRVSGPCILCLDHSVGRHQRKKLPQSGLLRTLGVTSFEEVTCSCPQAGI